MRALLFGCALALLGTLVPQAASADPFVIRTSRPDYAAYEAARPLTLEKEWLELGVLFDSKSVNQYTDSSGEVHDATYQFNRNVANLSIRYGLTSRWNLFMHIPFVVSTAVETGAGVEARDSGLGDLKLGADWEMYGKREPSVTSVVLRVWTKQASGNEARGSLGDTHIILGTGTTDLGAMVLAKKQLPMSAVHARAGYIRKFSDIVQYVFDETNGGGLNGRIKLGDEVVVGAGGVFQPEITLGERTTGMFGLAVDAQYSIKQDAAVGKTGNNVFGAGELERVPDSGGSYLDASARLLIEPSANWTVALGATVPIMSQNSDRLWPLEDQNPSYGVTYNANALFRW